MRIINFDPEAIASIVAKSLRETGLPPRKIEMIHQMGAHLFESNPEAQQFSVVRAKEGGDYSLLEADEAHHVSDLNYQLNTFLFSQMITKIETIFCDSVRDTAVGSGEVAESDEEKESSKYQEGEMVTADTRFARHNIPSEAFYFGGYVNPADIVGNESGEGFLSDKDVGAWAQAQKEGDQNPVKAIFAGREGAIMDDFLLSLLMFQSDFIAVCEELQSLPASIGDTVDMKLYNKRATADLLESENWSPTQISIILDQGLAPANLELMTYLFDEAHPHGALVLEDDHSVPGGYNLIIKRPDDYIYTGEERLLPISYVIAEASALLSVMYLMGNDDFDLCDKISAQPPPKGPGTGLPKPPPPA